MAETELEALNEIIGQNSTIISNQTEIISNQEEIIVGLNLSGETSYIQDIISNQELLHSYIIHDVEEIETNRFDEIILNTTPIYESEDVIAQDTFIFENLQEIKEMQFSNYILIGVVLAVGLLIAIKGIFKNVT